MDEDLKKMAKLAAHSYQARRVDQLHPSESELVGLLVKHGYLRAPTNGFVGSMTNKAMVREIVPKLDAVQSKMDEFPSLPVQAMPVGRPRHKRFGP